MNTARTHLLFGGPLAFSGEMFAVGSLSAGRPWRALGTVSLSAWLRSDVLLFSFLFLTSVSLLGVCCCSRHATCYLAACSPLPEHTYIQVHTILISVLGLPFWGAPFLPAFVA